MKNSRLWVLAIVCGALSVLAGAAQATPMNVVLHATITQDTTNVVLGSPLDISMVLESTTANEGTPGDYLATNPATATINLLGTDLLADITSIENAAGIWTMVGVADLNPLGIDAILTVTGPISGTGLTPDQILPDFAMITNGEINVDLSFLGEGQFATATVGSIDITPVPEPTTALLVGLGMVGLGVGRRRGGRSLQLVD